MTAKLTADSYQEALLAEQAAHRRTSAELEYLRDVNAELRERRDELDDENQELRAACCEAVEAITRTAYDVVIVKCRKWMAMKPPVPFVAARKGR